MDERERHKQGMATRRSVLGDAHVERAEKNRNDFNSDFQDFIIRYAWGDVWSRPGMDKETRSLITIVMLIALNREDELRMHLRSAANTGVSREEIKEAILQSGLYCGLPAANGAMHLAQEVFETTEEWRGRKD